MSEAGKTFYEFLDEIENTGPTSEKEHLMQMMLEAFPESEEFLRLAYDGAVYGLNEKSFYNAFEMNDTAGPIESYPHVSDWLKARAEILETLQPVISLKEVCKDLLLVSGHELLNYLFEIFAYLPEAQAKWWSRAILHELRMGANLKTINSVFKSMGKKPIPKFEMMLANKIDVMDEETMESKVKFPCAIETKYDGIRIQAEVFQGEVTLTSRRGKDRTEDYPDIVEALQEAFKAQDHVILDGEIIRLADCEAGHSFQQLMRKDSNAKRRYVVFDLLMQEDLAYSARWDNLYNLFLTSDLVDTTDVQDKLNINIKDKLIKAADTIILSNHHVATNIIEVQDFYWENVDAKAEGIMIKDLEAPYLRGKRTKMLKCKPDYIVGNRASNEADLLIVGWKYGSGVNHDKVGTLELQDATGLRVDVGSGIDDWWRSWLTERKDELKGMICEIRYNEITETGSLRFPRFITIREDKDEPDTI